MGGWLVPEAEGGGRVDDNAVKVVGWIFHLIDGLSVMCLEADLPAVGPSAAQSGIPGEGVEDDVVIYLLVSNPMRGQITDLGKGIFLEPEYDVADEFR